MRSYRLHWPAIVVAMLASFLFEAAWYSLFLKPWVAAIGHDMQWLESSPAIRPALQFAVALLCSFITASILSLAIQASGPQTFFRGIKVGIVVWFGFIATALAKNYIFEVRPPSLYAINLTYGLIDIILIGAIVGAWKGKPKLP
jgi:hypothetical protein